MADDGGKGNDSGGVMLNQMQGEFHPQGFLSLVGWVERSYFNERGGAIIDPAFLTTPQRTEIMEIGFRSSFASGIAMALLFPLAIGVMDRHIAIFGAVIPTWFDLFCGLLLALIFPLGYSCFLAYIASQHLGGYTRAMITNLLGGVAMAAMIKMVVLFIGFHVIYFKVVNGPNVAWVLKHLSSFKLSYNTSLSIYAWIMDFRPVFIKSAYYVAVSSIVFIAIPYVSMLLTQRRNKKLITSGVYNVFNTEK